MDILIDFELLEKWRDTLQNFIDYDDIPHHDMEEIIEDINELIGEV